MAEEEEKKEESQDAPEPTAVEAGQETEELLRKLEDAQKAAELFKDQLLRKAAEFENYKKRTEAEAGLLIKSANEGLILALLPILDDFRRSLKQGGAVLREDPFFLGVELIQNKFSKLLEQYGLSPFDSVGQPFDVEYHDALLQMPSDTVPAHVVLEEVERGYKLNGKVLRHAKVIVSSGKAGPGNVSGGDGEDDVKEVKTS
jgi:molecular chaperone GrpE